MTLRVVTWNMNHRVKLKKCAWNFLRYEVAPDIALVQEAHPPDDLGEGERFVYPEIEEIRGKIGASGIWSRALPIHRIGITTALPDALVAATFTLPKSETRFHVISMYGTFDETSHVTPNLHRMISDLHPVFTSRASRERIILGGDWNIDPKYNENYPSSAPLHRIVLERLEDPFYGLQKCNKESLRTINHGSKFSYQDDYIYVSKWLIRRLISCDVVKVNFPPFFGQKSGARKVHRSRSLSGLC
ncbi:MAG TPA: endonuclease/exonuclease/phosphatase family protein [Candidatus Desulfaltia sp.]|nr:endonuclease/exonuclease/phosphatase family protein [Candidatus Desulfaltia sp.]